MKKIVCIILLSCSIFLVFTAFAETDKETEIIVKTDGTIVKYGVLWKAENPEGIPRDCIVKAIKKSSYRCGLSTITHLNNSKTTFGFPIKETWEKDLVDISFSEKSGIGSLTVLDKKTVQGKYDPDWESTSLMIVLPAFFFLYIGFASSKEKTIQHLINLYVGVIGLMLIEFFMIQSIHNDDYAVLFVVFWVVNVFAIGYLSGETSYDHSRLYEKYDDMPYRTTSRILGGVVAFVLTLFLAYRKQTMGWEGSGMNEYLAWLTIMFVTIVPAARALALSYKTIMKDVEFFETS